MLQLPDAEQIHNLPRRLEAHPLILADDNSAQLHPAVSDDFDTPNEANRAHPVSVAEEMSMSRFIILKPPAPNSTPWNAGTQGLYPRPKGALSPNTSAWQESFPLWKVRVDGLEPQQAMLQIADNLSSNSFYIAADDWTHRNGRIWGIGKRMELSAMRQSSSLTS
jgi:hypothetical protein